MHACIGEGNGNQLQYSCLENPRDENGMQVVIHCIGDGIMEWSMDGLEAAMKASPREDCRHGIVHCQITDLPLLKRFRDLKLLALIQPIFLHYDMHIVEERVGKALASTSYNWKTLLDLQVPSSFGTDCPVENLAFLSASLYQQSRT